MADWSCYYVGFKRLCPFNLPLNINLKYNYFDLTFSYK